MKFAEHLQAHLTPEWRTQYVDYDELKDILYKCLEEAPKEDDVEARHQFFADADENFFVQCERQLEKINNFFVEKVAESKRKLENLEWELREYKIQVAEKHFARSNLTLEIKSDRTNPNRHHEHTERASIAVQSVGRASTTSPVTTTDILGRTIAPTGLVFRRREERKKKKKRVRKLHGIKLAFQEFYLNLILLQNFQTLNFTGFRKILKKHDKLFEFSTGYQWRVRNVESAIFNVSKEVTGFITRVEQIYIDDLEQGNRQVAMKRLRVPPLTEQENPWSTFFVGFCYGIFLMQLISIVLAGIYIGGNISPWEPGVRLFRGSFLIVLFLFCLGINTYGWRSSGVNHVLIFEIDPRNHLNHTDILLVGGVLAVLWGGCLQFYLFSVWTGTPAYLTPFILVITMLLFLFNPLPCCQLKSRRWLIHIMYRIFTAPLHPVTFADFWLADQLNSLATVFLDFEFFTCFYTSQIRYPSFIPVNKAAFDFIGNNATLGSVPISSKVIDSSDTCSGLLFGFTPVISCLPAWFRFAQCIRRYYDMKERHAFPHLVNAGKYSMTFLVVITSTLYKSYLDSRLLVLWIVVALLATVYTYSWDIFMDWGLMDRPAKGKFLREELVYHHRWYYFFAIIEDLCLRLTWTIDIACRVFQVPGHLLISCFLSGLEVIRRFWWNFFRLENEHLNNCGQFRAVRDIYIEPIRPEQTDVVSPSGTDEVPNAPKRYAPYLYQQQLSSERINGRPESIRLTRAQDDDDDDIPIIRSNPGISYADAYPRNDLDLSIVPNLT